MTVEVIRGEVWLAGPNGEWVSRLEGIHARELADCLTSAADLLLEAPHEPSNVVEFIIRHKDGRQEKPRCPKCKREGKLVRIRNAREFTYSCSAPDCKNRWTLFPDSEPEQQPAKAP